MSVLRRSAYAKWIAENRPADPWGKCEALTQLMATAFPELRRVRGHYVCPLQGRLPHWWMVGRCETPRKAAAFALGTRHARRRRPTGRRREAPEACLTRAPGLGPSAVRIADQGD
jgi:hypothetical protein